MDAIPLRLLCAYSTNKALNPVIALFLIFYYNPAVEVVRVHMSISRRGQTWRRGDHLKILKGATGQMKASFCTLKNSLCTTLEYIVVEGLQGDICGEFTHALL
jgi:hypothetical protein